ncbi:FtsX-like permease family protein [Flavobacterium sp. Sd200]|uniref:ABC transporter permease n=1 Tax=Flavobacterium sp. Sd200 TaxID=2692211 RepID=UPI00136A866F|nr:ABC transporter permease [Flavobacterium sp. Sd200]MXN91069.1 FtsX-like permease family protein [Flavobacterium sp. Sd200]
MIARIAWKNIWFKPLNTLLSIILLTASVAIITLLILLQDQFEKQFNSNIDNIDLVLGAQGSPLQLILSAVYQADAPTGNIDYTEAKTWMKHRFVQTAVPLAFGDNYKGIRIVGTTPDYLKVYGNGLKEGKIFSHNFEVVIGSAVAQKMGLKLGDKFFGSHGDAAEGEVHENHAYIVTGIAAPTGKVIDNLILCNVPSVWAMHDEEGHHHSESEIHEDVEDHGHHEAYGHSEADEHDEAHEHRDEHHDEVVSEEGKEITAVLIKFRSKMGIVMWPRLIAQNTKMQAASPAIEVNRLFSLFGIGLQALQYLAYGIMLISGISIFIALYNTLKERKYEFALLRVNGASRTQLLWLVLIESLLLCVTGFIFGTVVGRIALSLIPGQSESEFKMSFNPFEFVWQKEGYLLGLTIFVGIFAAVIPAVKAYRLNISKTLANA